MTLFDTYLMGICFIAQRYRMLFRSYTFYAGHDRCFLEVFSMPRLKMLYWMKEFVDDETE